MVLETHRETGQKIRALADFAPGWGDLLEQMGCVAEALYFGRRFSGRRPPT
jgi:hypothetical protein